MVDLINLPTPRPLLPSLLDVGCSREIATAASKLYQQRAEEFKRRIETTLIAAWQRMATLSGVSVSSLEPLTSKDLSTFTQVYLRCLEEWKEEMVQLLKQTPRAASKTVSPRNYHAFNHEYLPLLERFFEENPLPAHADKVFLAKKSNMQYRQIHVWFQNRRSRTKKDAKPLRKKPVSEGATKPIDKLYERVKSHPVKPVSPPVRPSQSSLSRVGHEQIQFVRDDSLRSTFNLSAPPHAFPSPYPPPCTYDPFPCKCGPVSFGKPEWRRVSCPNPPLSVPISVDDLAEKFSRLNVRCHTRNKGPFQMRSHAATAAITVQPSRAPHPSLIVYKPPNPTHVAIHQLSTCASTPPSNAFRSPSAPTNSVAPIPLSVRADRNQPSVKRKTAPLPQRFPGRAQNTKRDTSPLECSSTSLSSHASSTGFESRSNYSLSSTSSSPSPTSTASVQELPQSLSCLPCGSSLCPGIFRGMVPPLL